MEIIEKYKKVIENEIKVVVDKALQSVFSQVKSWKSDEKVSIDFTSVDFTQILEEVFSEGQRSLETKNILDFINSKTQAVKEGEESCISVYRTLRGLKNVLESAIKEIESDVVAEVEANPKEYLDFRVSTRKTYQYNTSPLYAQKQQELKDIETLLKQATENKNKGLGYVTDADGMIIDPIEVKYTQVLTYSPKGV